MTAGEWKSIHRRFSSVDGSALFLLSVLGFVAVSASPRSSLRFRKERLLVLGLLFPLARMDSDVGGQKAREFMLRGLQVVSSCGNYASFCSQCMINTRLAIERQTY